MIWPQMLRRGSERQRSASSLCCLAGAAKTDELPPPKIPRPARLPRDSAATVPDSMVPTDSTIIPTDSTLIDSSGVTTLAGSVPPGIVFGVYNMDVEQMTSVLNGTMQGGGLTPDNILSRLAAARAKGARMVVKMCMGDISTCKNPDGTFSLTKWKSLVDRFKSGEPDSLYHRRNHSRPFPDR